MSQSVTTQKPIPSTREHEHVPESSSTPGLQLPLIDSLPSSPSLYSEDTDDEHTRTNTNTMISQPTTDQAPALPEKSARRMSRMLDGLIPHKLPSTDEQPPLATQSAPHDVYLSSEEDASSSADDFSDFECDSSSEESESSTRRSSHEDTARVVSVIFSGKPSIVDLPRRSISPSSCSSDTSSRPPSRLRRTSTLPVIDRRASMCSSPSGSSVVSSPSVLHPPRTSSMLPGSRLGKQKPAFLNIDPFASRQEEPEENEPKPPKTPTGVFKRTLSLVRKRSRPTLNTYYSLSRDNLSNMILPHHMEQVREESTPKRAPVRTDTPAPAPPRAPAARPVSRGPVTYHEIVNSAKRRAQTTPMSPISPMSEPPASPMTPNNTRHRLRFSSARRLSMRA